MKKNTTSQPDDGKLFEIKAELLDSDLRYYAASLMDISIDMPLLGIKAGDVAVVKRTTKIFENRLTIWKARDAQTNSANYIYDNFGDVSIIFPDGEIKRYKRKDITIHGVLIGVIRPIGAQIPEQIDALEIEVVCSDCGKTQTGSEQFLKGMGWKLKGKPRCLNCDLY